MKYEFHVGDYVETKDGWIGYVNEVYSTDNSLDIVWTSGNAIIGKIVHADWELLYDELVRIGQYDFTKKDEGKIEPLACETASDYSNEKLRKKINELVEAINRLEEKVNEMV